jgi:hypothetical protein
MALDSTSQVAKIIGDLRKGQRVLEESIPDESDSNFLLAPSDGLKITGEVVFTKKLYDPQSFILDHPVQGELDSPILVIDGGYLSSGMAFPISFPLSFDAEGSEVIFTTTF